MNPDSSSICFPSGMCTHVDYFNGFSPVYFLSHFHMDHVVGLRDVKHQCKIYCSDITRHLVLADPAFRSAHPLLSALPVNAARPVPELPGVSVTLIPAGHCLGSVMFLFEQEEETDGMAAERRRRHTVLFTGDFRIPTERQALSRVAAFHRNGGVIPIDNIVVDTTFFTEHCRQLPTREESMQAICQLVRDSLERASNQQHRQKQQLGVVLVARARFSYEYVYQSLAETLNIKVHIGEQGLRYYGQLAASLDFYSTQAGDCFVHLAGCGCDTGGMLNICLSTMYFDKVAGFTQPVVWPSERTARVLFSFHPSMREVIDLLAYLRPRAARALVIPSEDTCGEAVQSRLEAELRRCLDCQAAAQRPKRPLQLSGGSADTEFNSGGVGGGDCAEEDQDSDDSLCALPAGGVSAKMARRT